jgi:inner membrane protein
MDNITHSLTGLALGELVGRSLPAEPDPERARLRHRLLLVSSWAANNFPDLDLMLTPLAPRPLGYLLQHRGHTHTLLGAIPQALLLLALVWLMWPAARRLLRESAQARLATVGVVVLGLLLHVGMDYMNVYGVHPFYPLDARWFYGDMVFIAEPVFWIAFGTPLAMVARPGATRNVACGLLVLVPVLFTALGYLHWGSLAGLAVIAAVVAWIQWRTPERGRAALAAAFAIAGLFVAGQAMALREARAVAAAEPHHGRLLDAALSAFPANPLCWSLVATELDAAAGTYEVRRALISIAPQVVPVKSCPSQIAGPAPAASARVAGPASAATGAIDAARKVAWQWSQTRQVADLRALRERDCRMDAWLRFARSPALDDGFATDARFGPPGALNFSSLAFGSQPGEPCPYPVPGWGYPRADLLGLPD